MEGDGWDLQAVVSGCSGSTATVDPFSSFPSLALQGGSGEQDDLRFCFPELFDTQTELFELEDLWKPFFPDSPQPQSQPQQQIPLSPQRSISSSSSAAPQLPPAVGEAALLPLPQLPTRPPQQRTLPHTPKSRRRKSQQKKVVCHVPADGLSSDMWAWRKYGQKPIKGSPYPRGYYRCSTSKGCVARKQVERSRVDPGEFVVTYTGEHNHPLPTHRNSLAGSTRNKLPAPPSADASSAAPGAEPGRSECKAASPSPLSSPTPSGLSPTTPLAASVEEELLLPRGLGGQKGEGGEEVEGEEEEDLLLVGDIEMLGEDDVLFMGFEELREPTAGIFGDAFSEYLGAFPTQWTASNAAAAAGGS